MPAVEDDKKGGAVLSAGRSARPARRAPAKRTKGLEVKKRARRDRPYPTLALADALKLAEAIVRVAGGSLKVRRLTLWEKLERSPTSSVSREPITNSGKYGLTIGSYQAEWL